MPAPPPVKSASAAKRGAALAWGCGKPAAPARAPVVKTPVPKKTAAVDCPGCKPSTSRASGYVAVLSSKKSRMDALKAFADIQQKYGDVLASKTPDVQEADLGDKGLWGIVPLSARRGSRDAAWRKGGVHGQLQRPWPA